MLQIDVSLCGEVQSSEMQGQPDGEVFHIRNKNVSKHTNDLVNELIDGLEVIILHGYQCQCYLIH